MESDLSRLAVLFLLALHRLDGRAYRSRLLKIAWRYPPRAKADALRELVAAELITVTRGVLSSDPTLYRITVTGAQAACALEARRAAARLPDVA